MNKNFKIFSLKVLYERFKKIILIAIVIILMGINYSMLIFGKFISLALIYRLVK